MEMARTLNALKNLPSNCIIQFPSGRWGFVGSVSAKLGYQYADGRLIETDEDQAALAKAKWGGMGFQKTFKTRSYETREAAMAEVERLGLNATE